jgi:hypothetical protein
LEDPGVDGRVLLRRIFKKWDRGMNCIDLAQGKGKVADTCERGNEPSVLHKMRRISCLAENQLAYQGGLCSIE